MLVLILLVIILVIIVYLTKKENIQTNKTGGYDINESTFNPQYKISKNENGLEIVQSCGR